MAPVTIISWNVRGLNSRVKRSLVFNFLKLHRPDICILQETHLTGGRVLSLKKPWVGHYYNATFSSYARGVSILIHKNLTFTLLDLHLDPEGRYVAMHAVIANMPMVIVGLYIPPPASLLILNKIARFIAGCSTDNVVLAGDFNMPPCPAVDRLTPDGSVESPLSKWASTFDLTDVWRWKNPLLRSYTCQSASYRAMSRIDLIFATRALLTKVQEISHLPRGISDHSPILLKLNVGPAPADCLWRLSRYWVSDDRIAPGAELAVREYWAANPPATVPASTWEDFKFHARDHYQKAIGSTRRQSGEALLQAERRAGRLEAQYTANKDETCRIDLQCAMREVTLLRVAATRKIMLHQSQRIFEQGERTGRLLAWLSREQAATTSVANIKEASGRLLSDPRDINRCFASYYEDLYSSRVQYSADELQTYIDAIELPCLSVAARQRLDAPLTLKEIQTAIGSLQSGKTPGDDGFPVEFYKEHVDTLAIRLLEVLNASFDSDSLPPSMSRAVIIVIPKPGKDPDLCSSYRPISLLNVDAKILAKVLATRLNTVILSLIHGDQTGFMPGKGTDINLRRLFTVIASSTGEGGAGVVASLDAEKAFDSVEWEYLWHILPRFGMGPKFVKWVRLLYSGPTARVRTNGVLSASFPLHRGTRQGCPLSPALFALAIEPLAVILRAATAVRGMSFPPLTEKVSLYADDMLLYLQDDQQSLGAALSIINQFGAFSGVRVNWDKSLLFSLSGVPRPIDSTTPLKRVAQFKYLGIQVQLDQRKYLEDNVYPILQRFIQRCSVWKTLPLTPVGRINLIKMSFLPKFLYAFRHTPVPIPNSFFVKLDQAITSFVWAGAAPRIAKHTLQLSLMEGGLSLPNFKKYYWAAVLVSVRWWFTQDRANPAVNLEAAILGSYSELSNLVYRGPRYSPRVTTLMKTTVRVWGQVSGYLNNRNAVSPYTPLWGNPKLPHFQSIPDPQVWARYEIRTIRHIFKDDRLMSFTELKGKYHLPSWMFFRYVQLSHAARAQFPNGIVIATHSVESLLTVTDIDRILSSIYIRLTCKDTSTLTPLFTKWQLDIPELTEEDWSEGLQQCIPLMISARDRFIQMKFLHRVYYTPHRLANIYPGVEDVCPKCRQSVGTFFHVVWSCPILQTYWREVVSDINGVAGLHLDVDPLVFLLGITDNLATTKHTKLFVFYAAYYARKEILLRWKLPDPPTTKAWRAQVNAILPMYKLTYMGRNCPHKFEKIWAAWVEAKHLTV